METKKQIEEKLEELQGQLIKNQKDFREGVLNNDSDRTIFASIRAKATEEKIEILKWVLE